MAFVIEHGNRQVPLLGVTADATGVWAAQLVWNLATDLEEAGQRLTHLIRDRDAKFTAAFDAVFTSIGIDVVLTAPQAPRMNSIMERWVKTLRAEPLDRMLIWNETRLRHALHEYQCHDNVHRTHRSLTAAAPLRARPETLEAKRIDRLTVRRQDRLGGVIHEYRSTA